MTGKAKEIPRHNLVVRLLHWFNALIWLTQLITGFSLITSPHFRLLPLGVAEAILGVLGGRFGALRLHVSLGILWVLVVGGGALLLKKGIGALIREFVLTRDDWLWLLRRPPRLFGLNMGAIPPQDKYNAGQKVFGLAVLLGGGMIALTGLAMVIPGMPRGLIGWSVPLHQAAVLTVVLGALVHFFMAALVREERPVLRSMVTGRVSEEFAEHHSSRWLEELRSRDECAWEACGPVASNSTGREVPLWNPYWGGFILGLTLLGSFFVLGRGLGASGAFARILAVFTGWAAPDWTRSNLQLGRYAAQGLHPLDHYLVAMALGVILGGLLAGLLTRRVRLQILRGPRISARGRLALALAGGVLSGVGARLAHGCTSGQALSGGAMLGAGGWIFMMSVFAAAFGFAVVVRREWL